MSATAQFDSSQISAAPGAPQSNVPGTFSTADIQKTPSAAPKAPEQPSALSRFGSGLYSSTIGPMVQLVTHPIDTIESTLKTALGTDQVADVVKAVKGGDLSKAALLAAHYISQSPADRMAAPTIDSVVDSVKKGDYAGAGGKALGTVAMLATPELGEIEGSGDIASATGAGLKGAAKAAIEPIEYGRLKIPVPASVAGAAAGHYLGGTPGAVVGAVAPIIKGGVQAFKEALDNARKPEVDSAAAQANIDAMNAAAAARNAPPVNASAAQSAIDQMNAAFAARQAAKHPPLPPEVMADLTRESEVEPPSAAPRSLQDIAAQPPAPSGLPEWMGQPQSPAQAPVGPPVQQFPQVMRHEPLPDWMEPNAGGLQAVAAGTPPPGALAANPAAATAAQSLNEAMGLKPEPTTIEAPAKPGLTKDAYAGAGRSKRADAATAIADEITSGRSSMSPEDIKSTVALDTKLEDIGRKLGYDYPRTAAARVKWRQDITDAMGKASAH
jgi:hypothetical protein